MMRLKQTDHPLLYEINTRPWLNELGRGPGRKALSLADVPDSALDRLAGLHFDLVWLMGVWQTGEVGEKLAREFLGRNPEMTAGLPGFTAADIVSSPYAVQDYRVPASVGGPKALAALRRRLAKHGIGLILDFVPNHTACDHYWVEPHPEYYVPASAQMMQDDPGGCFAADCASGRKVLAHGRDPYFPPWGDTAQLNYQHPATRRAMIDTLFGIAEQCDGVRCDMSMLVLNEVFSRTWGECARPSDCAPASGEFWAEAIDAVRRRVPGFLFVAEAYWGLEPQLQALGFDYTYDKILYDRLRHGAAGAVREHLRADLESQRRAARFLENHDEDRAAHAFTFDQHRAAALVAYTTPGLRFFHHGQLEGRRFKLPVQLRRAPREPVDEGLRGFYETLLAELAHPVFRRGQWKLLEPRPAWQGNPSWEQFIVYRWCDRQHGTRLVAVNHGPTQAQCYVTLETPGLQGRQVVLRDALSDAVYERHGDSLSAPGLYLDMAPYQTHLFTLEFQ